MATASLGRLTLDLVARIGQFVEPMNRAERQAQESTDRMGRAFSNFRDQMNQSLGGTQFGSALDSVLGRVDSLRGGVLAASGALAGMAAGGTVLAVAGLSKMAIETAKADSEMAMLAMRAKVGIENFQIFSYAAEQLGISQDQLGSIFADVQEKLGEFSATGGGGAADFFDALKNNTKLTDDQIKAFSKTLQGKDGVEAVQLLKNKLDEVGASSQEQRFVFESLASDLGNLMPLFSEGGAKVEEYGKALQDAGVIKSKEAIQQSQILAAQTQAVNLQFQGAKNQLVQGFMPALVNVADAMFGTSKNGVQLQEVGDGLGTVFKGVAHAAIATATGVKFLANGLAGMAAIGAKISENMKWYEVNPLGFAKAAFQARTEIAALSADINANSSAMVLDAADSLDRLWAKTGERKSTTNTLTNAILQLNQAQNVATTGLKINTKEAEENAKAKEAQAKAIAKATKEQADLNKMVGASALSGLRIKSAESIAGGGVRAYTAEFAKMTQDLLGDQLVRFTSLNDKYHQGKGGKHPIGQAFDFTVKDASDANQSIQRIQEMAKKYGFAIKTLNEYSDPSSNAAGGHIHVSVLGYKGSADALKEANAELDIVRNANEEAIRIRDERAKQQLSVASRYATEEQLMAADNEQKIKDINLAFAGDKTALDKYLKLQADAYQKDVDNYQSAQQKKFNSFKQDFSDQINESQKRLGLIGVAAKYGRDSMTYKFSELNAYTDGSKKEANTSLADSIGRIQDEYSAPDQELKRQELIEDAYKAHKLRLQEIDAEHNEATKELNNQQASMQLQAFSALTGSLMGLVDQSSSAYTALYVVQKSFNLAQAAMNGYTAISAAWASAPFPYNMGAVAAATIQSGVLQAAIEAVTPTGYASGGYTGHGGKYDPAGIVHRGEGVLTQEEIAALGGPAGFYALRQSIKNGFADGGLVLDAPKLESPRMAATPKYLGQPTAVQQPRVNLNPNFVIVDEREKLGDYLYSPDGKKAFVKFFKQNRRELGFA